MFKSMEIKWKRLGANFVKVNVDFAAFTLGEYYGASAIIRDEHSQFLVARV